jgi:RNA polymerase sigma-70 factor (ECF subfamily)
VSDFEAIWLEQALHGDDDAFAQLVETYQRPVFNLCYRMLGDPQEAEDAAQESFWRAYQALHRYDPNRKFSTWLLSIAAHYCIDQQRKRHIVAVPMDIVFEETFADRSPNPEHAVESSEEDRMLHALMNAMNSQDRAALVLRYWYGFSDVEISEALSLSVSAVKSRLYRARQQLAQDLQAVHQESLTAEEEYYGSPTF